MRNPCCIWQVGRSPPVMALREYLKDVDRVDVVGDARNGFDAVRLIQKLEPDLVFLDVRMPGLTGLEVLETITHHAAVIFTTAYDEYALSAFEFGALDYLVKPFGKDRLMESLDRVRVRLVGEGITDDATFSSDSSLGEIQERLNPREFIRIHRGHVVNLSHVAKIEKYDERRFLIRLDDGSRLVASRRGSKVLRDLMG